MRYLKLYEDFKEELKSDSNILDKIKELMQNTPPIKDYASKIEVENIHIIANKIIWVELPGELESNHLKKHFDKNESGSTWTISQDEVKKLMEKTIESKPTFAGLEGPTGREIYKYKWLNLDCGKDIGLDSIKQIKPGDKVDDYEDLELFGLTKKEGVTWEFIQSVASKADYKLVKKVDNKTEDYTEEDFQNGEDCYIKQVIGVVKGEKIPTRLVNLVMSKIGEIDGKPVLTMMTVYPGISPKDKDGKDITNKKDFKASGFAFIKN